MIAEIELIREKNEEVEELRKTADRNRENLREFVLRDIIDAGLESPESLKDLLLMIGFPVVDTQYVSLLMELSSAGEREEVLRQFNETIGETLGKIYRFDLFVYSPSQLAVIISKSCSIHPDDLRKRLYEIRYNLANSIKGDLTFGVGVIYSEISGISKSFEEARYALSHQIIKGRNQVIFYDEIAKASTDQANITNNDISRLETGIESGNIENCSIVIDSILRGLVATPGISLPDIQLQCLNILLAGIRKIGPMPIQINEHLGKDLLRFEGIARFQTLEQLKQWLLQVIQGIIELRSKHIASVKKDLITEVKEYISFNYEHNLTLAVLAGKFFVNPFYLSQLFKEKTGETYLNYVTKVRIGKAKELLETTDLKMTEVCESVGYTDTKYFSKLFEKLVGCKPSEYKSRADHSH